MPPPIPQGHSSLPPSIEPPRWAPRLATEAALQRAEHALRAAPADTDMLFERACLLDLLARGMDARQAYLDVLARDMRHAGALANLGALFAATGYVGAALTTYAQAVAAHPEDAKARVNRANLLRQAERMEEARAEYETALRLDPTLAEAHQGMAHLLDGIDEAAASRHRALGFAGRALSTGRYRGESKPVTVLQLVSACGGNIPTARILDDCVFLTHTVVAEFFDPAARLPQHDVVLNAIGDADRCAVAIATAEALLERVRTPVLNAPRLIPPTARAVNTERLRRLPGVVAPRIVLLDRKALAAGPPQEFPPPFLLRSPGFHTGQHFRRIEDAEALAGALAALPGERLMAIEQLDAAGADGASRKYRVMLIGGEMLPLHLAISPDWKVHCYTAGMAERPAHRAEEARFLADMPAALGPVAMAALREIERSLGLDYAGVDFALAPDGRLLLFEANATMTMAPPPPDPIWAYRQPAFDRVLDTARALILRQAATVSGDENRA